MRNQVWQCKSLICKYLTFWWFRLQYVLNGKCECHPTHRIRLSVSLSVNMFVTKKLWIIKTCIRVKDHRYMQRVQRTESRGPKGLQVEVGARRALRLLVLDNDLLFGFLQKIFKKQVNLRNHQLIASAWSCLLTLEFIKKYENYCILH